MRATTHGLLPPKAPQVRLRVALYFRPAAQRPPRRSDVVHSPSIRRLLACASVRTWMGASARSRVPFVSRRHCLPSDPFASSHPPGRMLQVARRASRPPRCRRRRMPTGTPGRPLELGLANESGGDAQTSEKECSGVHTHCGPRSSKGAAQCLRTVVCVGPSPVRTPELSSLALEKRLRRRRKRAPYANAAAPCINAARPVESFIELCGPAA